MSLWIGRRQAVGIGRESSRGVGVSPTYWLNCNSFSFADKPSRALSEASFGGIWGGDQSPLTLNHAEGSFEVELGDKSFGTILYALLGTLATTGPTDTAAYTHAFSLNNSNQHQSLTITTKDPIGNFTYELAMINSFELSVQPDSIVTYTVDFMSKSSQDAGSYTDSYGAEKKFVGRHLSFKTASATSGLAAASAIDLRSLTLKIEKNAEVNSVLSTVQPIDIVNRRFSISGELTLNYEDRTWLNLVNSSNYKAVRISLTHDDTITGAASTKYAWTIDLSKCSFENFEPDFGMDDVVTQKVTFNALYDAGGNNNVINACSLVNGVVSY